MIGVLILNRNGRDWLPFIYESLSDEGYSNRRVYLVDNASDDGSVEMTLESFPEVNIIRMSQNMGYCMAYNLAIPYALADGCEWVIWANNDVRVEAGCLEKMLRSAQRDPRIGVLGPGFLAWERDEPNYYMVGNHPYAISAMRSGYPEPIEVEWVEGSFLMVSRSCLEAVGPLDPYLYFYWEEADFCRRARFHGWRVVLVPNALARHYAGGWCSADQQNKVMVNWLQSHNYYIYKLANPFQGFLENVLDAFHLLFINLKAYNPKKLSSIVFHMQVFIKVLSEVSAIYHKWKRDRRGERSPTLAPYFADLLDRQHIQVLKGVAGGHPVA